MRAFRYDALDKAIALAQGKAPKEYIAGLETTKAEWKKGA